MYNKHISDVLGIREKQHSSFDFVDVDVNSDNLLFLDPILIELGARRDIPIACRAQMIISDYFDHLFAALRDQDTRAELALLSHAREINATRLGYGNGHNGKGNSAFGLRKIILPLENLCRNIETIDKSIDLSVLLPGFAEDRLSDLLTNLLQDVLSDFTEEVFQGYGYKPGDIATYFYWNQDSHEWKQKQRKSFFVNGRRVLLTPKIFVRNVYMFNAEQYLRSVILERLQKKIGMDDKGRYPLKKKLLDRMKKSGELHWAYNRAIQYTKEYNEALTEYHAKLPNLYLINGAFMEDIQLDEKIYFKGSKIVY